MRWIINYIRQCFCKHEYEFIREVELWEYDFHEEKDIPIGARRIYRCKHCGYVQKIKL